MTGAMHAMGERRTELVEILERVVFEKKAVEVKDRRVGWKIRPIRQTIVGEELVDALMEHESMIRIVAFKVAQEMFEYDLLESLDRDSVFIDAQVFYRVMRGSDGRFHRRMSTSLSTMSVTTSDIVALNKNVGNPDNSYGTSTLRRLRHRFQSSSSASASFSSPKAKKTKRRQRSRTIGRTKKRDDELCFGDDGDESVASSAAGDEENFGHRTSRSIGGRISSRRGKSDREEREQFVDEDDDDIVLSSLELATLSDEEEDEDDEGENERRQSSESDSSKEPSAVSPSPRRERIESLSSGSGGGLRRNASSGSLRLHSCNNSADRARTPPQKSESHKHMHLRSASSGKFRRIANASKSAREKLRVPSRTFFADRRRLSATVPKKYAKTADEALNRKVSVVSPRFQYYDKCACHGQTLCLEQAKVRPGSDGVVGIPRGASYHDIEKQVKLQRAETVRVNKSRRRKRDKSSPSRDATSPKPVLTAIGGGYEPSMSWSASASKSISRKAKLRQLQMQQLTQGSSMADALLHSQSERFVSKPRRDENEFQEESPESSAANGRHRDIRQIFPNHLNRQQSSPNAHKHSASATSSSSTSSRARASSTGVKMMRDTLTSSQVARARRLAAKSKSQRGSSIGSNRTSSPSAELLENGLPIRRSSTQSNASSLSRSSSSSATQAPLSLSPASCAQLQLRDSASASPAHGGKHSKNNAPTPNSNAPPKRGSAGSLVPSSKKKAAAAAVAGSGSGGKHHKRAKSAGRMPQLHPNALTSPTESDTLRRFNMQNSNSRGSGSSAGSTGSRRGTAAALGGGGRSSSTSSSTTSSPMQVHSPKSSRAFTNAPRAAILLANDSLVSSTTSSARSTPPNSHTPNSHTPNSHTPRGGGSLRKKRLHGSSTEPRARTLAGAVGRRLLVTDDGDEVLDTEDFGSDSGESMLDGSSSSVDHPTPVGDAAESS